MTTFRTVRDAMNRSLATALNDIGADAGCSPLKWSIDASFSSLVAVGWADDRYQPDEVPTVLGAWKQFLHIPAVPTPAVSGTEQHSGETGGVTVTVWGVVDPDAFHADAKAFDGALKGTLGEPL